MCLPHCTSHIICRCNGNPHASALGCLQRGEIGQDPSSLGFSGNCFPFKEREFTRDSRLMEGQMNSCRAHLTAHAMCRCSGDPHASTQSSGTTPSETKHSGLSHKPPREERPRTRMCMHRRLHAGNLTSPPLPFSPLPHARLHAGSSSRRVCLAYAVPLIRTKKASPKKERDTTGVLFGCRRCK